MPGRPHKGGMAIEATVAIPEGSTGTSKCARRKREYPGEPRRRMIRLPPD